VDELTLRAPAKLNLVLRVGPRRADGFHPITSLMVALDGLDDTVTVRRSDVRTVTCPGIDGPANLAWKALDALEREVGDLPGLAVEIDKRIPAQAGLGGGSSDAAAVLGAADTILALGLGADRLEQIAAQVGSDVPFFMRGGAQWARGRGEELSPVQIPPLFAVITPPIAPLSTAAVYAEFDAGDPPPTGEPWPEAPDAHDLLDAVSNDLWPAARRLAPELQRAACVLKANGARTVLLCGSGGSLAALWAHEGAAREAAGQLGALAAAVVRTHTGA
jgi:4-diphosphocytidyl-2-C-methyl-D-erythritol kinase